MSASFEERREAHARFEREQGALAERAEQTENRISAFRLLSFAAAASAFYWAVTGGGFPAVGATFAGAAAFIGGVVAHSRVAAGKARAEARQRVHQRHLQRLAGQCPGRDGSELLPADHAYARDIDVVGVDGLVSRLDATHTTLGARKLVEALATGLEPAQAQARQEAVRELVDRIEWRREVEVATAQDGEWATDLDAAPFLAFTQLPSLFTQHRWLRPVMWLLPLCTLAGIFAARTTAVGAWAWLLPVTLQMTLLWWSKGPVHEALNWITARIGFAESFMGMMTLLEEAKFDSSHLRALQASLSHEGQTASGHMRQLARYEALAQLRTQGPVYLVINVLTLWDLYCLERLEHFNADVGPHCVEWFEALAELEVLCSLATLADADPDAHFPELAEGGELRLESAAHPLLTPDARVANDISLDGPSSAWVVTGSNMAGKSTLLRAVGLNVALALAGGPVMAKSARIPWVRLRASMRIEDSLQRGASYFRAELTKLQSVVADLKQAPPVLFLLDEVLRGTNTHARSVGAAAVVRHLLRDGAMGLVATHDTALAALENDGEFTVGNRHFTDVFEGGEMTFDYRLRPGVVKTSNALELLRMAGIDVQIDVRTGAQTGVQEDGATP